MTLTSIKPANYSRTNQEQPASARRFGKVELLVLVVIVLAGLVHLPQPFQDDQAFFTIGAWKMSHGAVLYRDYWDIKQPGIFLFYLAGGKLFGFNEIGIHGFELLYMIGLAIVLIITLRDYLEQCWSSAAAALLTVGFYYGVSGLPHLYGDYLTNVEGLVGFPMFLCLWFAARAAKEERRWWDCLLISGITGGLVLLLKLLFLPVLLSFWITSFLYLRFQRRRHENIFSAVMRFSVPIVLGLLGPVLIVCGYFVWHHSLSSLFFTTFLWPLHAIGKLPHGGPGRLVDGLAFFVDGFAPLLALGFVGAWSSLRRQKDLITINLLLWIVTGTVVILIQLRSWWPYHYLLLIVPFGILGARGVEYVWAQLQLSEARSLSAQRRIVLIFGLILLFSPVIFPELTDAALLARYKFAITGKQRLSYQCRYPHSQYTAALGEIGFLSKPDSLPGTIYVGGSPLYYLLSGRRPAIALSYGLDDLLPEQWVNFSKELTEARPPYVFLIPMFRALIQTHSPETLGFIDANYRVLHRDDAGTWYVLKEPKTGSARSNSNASGESANSS
jgi:hypothetical protein